MKLHRFFFIALCVPLLSWTQEVEAEEDLRQILIELEAKFGVQFSYLDEVIAGKEGAIDTTQSLAQNIHVLELDTRLRFESVSDDYIIVRNYKSSDKVSLCGQVSNHRNDRLLGVSVGYTRQEGVFTDGNGRFQLDSIPYDSWLTFRYVGYAPKRLKVSRLSFQNCTAILMAESIEELQEVIVSDYLAAGIVQSKNATIIDSHTLKALSGLSEPDIMQSIQQVPGVNSPFETAAGIHVRGGLPDQNLILWNGIKTYSQGHFFGMISTFNPYVTDKVSFIKHGTSAQYGDRISSVIDIASKDEVSNEFTGGVGTNMLYSDGYINIPILTDKLSIQLSARRSFTDFLQTPTYSQMSDRVFQNTKIGASTAEEQQAGNSFYFNDYSFNSAWQINNNNKLIISSLYNRNELDFESEDVDNNLSFSDQLIHANEGLSVFWKKRSEARLSFDVGTSYSKYILKYSFLRNEADTSTESSKKNFVRDVTFHLNGKYKLNANSSLNSGFNINNTRIQYAYETEAPSYRIILDSDNSTIHTYAGYAEYAYEDEKFFIRPGVRITYYEQLNEVFLEPRLYAQRQVFPKISASLSAEYRTQAASQIKESVISDLSLENKVWSLASPDRFPILTSLQIGSGLRYKRKSWLAELEGYRKEVNGVTTLIFGYLNGLDNQFREGKSSIYGIDSFLKKTWMNYETWFSYSFIRTQNTFSGLNDDQPFPGSWSIEHTLRWSNIATFRDWEVSLGWMWHTGKSYTEVLPVEDGQAGPVRIFYEAINANNLPPYHRLDFSVLKEFRSKKASNIRYRVGLSVLNIYNRRNLLNREFRTTPSLENDLIDTRVYSLGITPNFVFRFFW
ncbi:MAG: carboxypeptidase-like regulatory domain-containing protein [Ekhidna sp.]